MALSHDSWYTRVFSDPKIIEELLKSFVDKPFVKDLDFTQIRKLNTKFVSKLGYQRLADIVFEIKYKGCTAFIYLFLEFQSTVDRFMVLRMARYQFEFYQEIQKHRGGKFLNPSFPILIYNGDQKWNTPESFRQLLNDSTIPILYLPEFRYFKIAVNEIPKRNLVKIRNAVATIFYIENSSVIEIGKQSSELVSLLKDVLKKDGYEILNAIVERIYAIQKIPVSGTVVKNVNDLTRVSTMLETRTKRWEKQVFDKGLEKGLEKVATKMLRQSSPVSSIRSLTGLSSYKINLLKKKCCIVKTKSV